MEGTVIIDSDSNSSEENSPVVKKSNPGRRRGLANRLKISNIGNEPNIISNDAAIYSTRVQKCFENPSGSVTLQELRNQTESDNEIEEVTVTSLKRKSPRQKGSDSSGHTSISLLDDDDDDVSVCTPPDDLNLSSTSLQSPPPPPSPPLPRAVTRQKKPRMNKDLKKALKNLSDTKEHLYLNEYVQKFQTADDDVICLDDNDNSMTLRISCGTSIYRIKVLPTEPFRNVLPEIATKRNVKENQLLLVHNDRTISSSDSPEGLGITAADIVECHIKHGDWSEDLNDSIDIGNNCIKIYVQTSNSRQKLEFIINRTNPLDKLVNKYCDKTNAKPSDIKLKFDGEDVYLCDTADDLEIEEGYTLDVIHTK